MSLISLPNEIIYLITKDFTTKDILSLMNTCQSMHKILIMWDGWRNLVLPKSKRLVTTLIQSILPRIRNRIKSFDVNGYKDFSGLDLGQVHLVLHNLHSLNLRGCKKIIETDLLAFFNSTTLPTLQTLIVTNMGSCITDLVLKTIGRVCTHLQVLDVSQFKSISYTDTGLIALLSHSCQETLLEVYITNTKLSNLAFVEISRCSRLRVLDCSGSFLLDDTGLISILANCKALKVLNLSYCWRISNNAFARMSQRSTVDEGGCLEKLNVQFCYQLTGIVLVHLSRLQRLNWVCVTECSIENEVLINFKRDYPKITVEE